ncbi:cytochrome oxidase complex assembly protein 1-domain-containing protein [Daedaleopsis nitida]|nr:cytochrome oxidase complex assembly protein 1-domain-containing protein [Daedaleopsis nitida]
MHTSFRASLRVPTRAPRIPSSAARPSMQVRGILRAGYTSSSSQSDPHPHKPLPEAETFDKTARPGLYYSRPSPRDLPPLKSKWPAVLALGVVGVAAWAVFMVFVTNQEKLSSSIMQQIMNAVRESPELRAVIGEAIRPEPVWWMNGDPRIDGAIHIPGGNIDLSFRVKGHKGAGTLYFTSIRRAKGEPFQILRFKVIADDGTEVNVATAKAS